MLQFAIYSRSFFTKGPAVTSAASAKKPSSVPNEGAKRCIQSDSESESPVKPRKRVKRAIVSSSSEDDEPVKVETSPSPSKENKSANVKAEDTPSGEVKSKKEKKKVKVNLTPKSRKKSPSPVKEEATSAQEDNSPSPKAKAKAEAKKKVAPKKRKAKDENQDEASEENSSSDKNLSPRKEGKEIVDEEKTKPTDKKSAFAAFFGKKDAQKGDGNANNIEYEEAVKKSRYHPIDDAIWKKDTKTPYLAFAKTLKAIEATSGRLKTIEILSNYFRSVLVLSPDDLLPSVYLCLNRLAPAYEGVEIGIGEQLLIKAIAQTTGRSTQQIKADSSKLGDLGIVAESSKGSQRTMFQPAPLTVVGVFEKLKDIAKMTGHSVMNHKVNIRI